MVCGRQDVVSGGENRKGVPLEQHAFLHGAGR